MKWILSKSSLFLRLEEAYRSSLNFSTVTSLIFRNLFIFFSSLITIFVLISFLPSHSLIDQKVVGIVFIFLLLSFPMIYYTIAVSQIMMPIYNLANTIE